MAITWGSWQYDGSKAKRLGYEFAQSAAVGSGTSSVDVNLKIYLNTNWGVSDSSNSFVVSGSWSRSGSHGINQNNGDVVLIYDVWIAVATSYSGTVQRSFSASISGIEAIGGTASVSGTHTVARRPYGTPGVPTGLTYSSLSASGVTLSWTAPSSFGGAPLVKYKIQVDTSPTFANVGGSGAYVSTTSYAVTGLNPNVQYYARVLAYNDDQGNGGGPSAYTANVSFTTPAVAPSTVSSISYSDVTSSSIKLSWLEPSNWGGNNTGDYDVLISTDPAFSGATPISVLNATTYTATGLTRATKYYFAVRAKNSGGAGDYSNSNNATTLAVAPGVPQNVVVTVLGPNSLKVDWAAPSDWGGENAGDYDVLYVPSTGGSAATLSVLDAVTRTITGLTPGVTYNIQVRAKNSIGPGNYTGVVTGKTLSGGSVRTASGFTTGTVTVWNGSAFVQGTVTVWNGSSFVSGF